MFKIVTPRCRKKTRLYQSREVFERNWMRHCADADHFKSLAPLEDETVIAYQQVVRRGKTHWRKIRHYSA